MAAWSHLVTGPDWLQIIVGGAIFWFPGVTWALALARRLGPVKWVPLSIVLAFTVQPAAMLFLNVLFGVPVRLGTTATLSVAMGLAGLAIGLRSHVATVFRG